MNEDTARQLYSDILRIKLIVRGEESQELYDNLMNSFNKHMTELHSFFNDNDE